MASFKEKLNDEFKVGNNVGYSNIVSNQTGSNRKVLSDPGLITVEMYRDYMTHKGKTWLVEINSLPVGFVSASIEDFSIWALFVRPGFEGKGVGQKLITQAVEWLFDKGAEKINLSTESGTRAERFYQKNGWLKQVADDSRETCFVYLKK